MEERSHVSTKKGRPAPGRNLWMVGGLAVVAVAVVIGISLMLKPDPAPTPTASGASGAQPNVRGSATAKVTLIEYGDYK